MRAPPTGEEPGGKTGPNDFYYLQTQTGWQRTLASFARWCAPQSGWRVLDAGCGPGIFPALFYSMGCQAIGIDIDPQAFLPEPLYPDVVIADVSSLPFPNSSFDLITASNLLFLLPNPVDILCEFRRLLHLDGQVALLNPSEQMNMISAVSLADERKLDQLSRKSLLSWASQAETHARWDQPSLDQLFGAAGMRLVETSLHIGPGLARFARGCLLS
jgi:ubiquinone/menaquinone biosynthesis C-methylase UbiE